METRNKALKILIKETDSFESQSRLRDDVLDAMLAFGVDLLNTHLDFLEQQATSQQHTIERLREIVKRYIDDRKGVAGLPQ